MNEIAKRAGVGMILQEIRFLSDSVKGACEVLGGPLYVQRGKLLALVARRWRRMCFAKMQQHDLGATPSIIGEVVAAHPAWCLMKTQIGGTVYWM